MTVVGLMVDNENIELKRFVIETNQRLKAQYLIFDGGVSIHGDILLYRYRSFQINKFLYYVSLFVAFILFVFSINIYWYLLPAIIMSLNIFTTGWFIAYLLKKGLKKTGYNGTMILMKHDEIIEYLLENGTR